MIEPLEVSLRGLAAYYLAEAFVRSVMTFSMKVWPDIKVYADGRYPEDSIYTTTPNPSKLKKILAGKPFNCNFCMVGWISLIMWFIPIGPYIYVPAIACVAYGIQEIIVRIKTIIL